MRLHLELPASWRPVAQPGGRVVVAITGDLSLAYGPLAPLPADPRSWIQQALTADLPPGMTLRVQPVALRSKLGWPLSAAAAEVVDASGEVVEVRLCVCYGFLEYAALAGVRGAAAAAAAHEDELHAVLASGRPDWRGPVIAEQDIWDGLSPATRSVQHGTV